MGLAGPHLPPAGPAVTVPPVVIIPDRSAGSVRWQLPSEARGRGEPTGRTHRPPSKRICRAPGSTVGSRGSADSPAFARRVLNGTTVISPDVSSCPGTPQSLPRNDFWRLPRQPSPPPIGIRHGPVSRIVSTEEGSAPHHSASLGLTRGCHKTNAGRVPWCWDPPSVFVNPDWVVDRSGSQRPSAHIASTNTRTVPFDVSFSIR
jgi:hypothetical protein